MARFLLHSDLPGQRRSRNWFLALFWSLGLVLGCILFSRTDSVVLSLMRGAPDSSVSVVSLLGVITLPFLVSAFAVYLGRHRLLYTIAFCKGALFTCVSLGVWTAFGAAGWLVRFLLMFSDILTVPLLFLYWIRNLEGEGRWDPRETAAFIGIAAGIGILDICFIAPFLASVYT